MTPGFGPCAGPGWPGAVIVRGSGFGDVVYRGEGVRVGRGGGGRGDDAEVDAGQKAGIENAWNPCEEGEDEP